MLMPKTRAAIAAYDKIERELDELAEVGDDAACARLVAASDEAKRLIGEAYAEETADRNPDRAATASWASWNIAETLAAVDRIEATP